MWCPDCQQQVAVRLKPGESVVRCARCGAKFSAPSQARRVDATAATAVPAPRPMQAAVMASSGAKATPCPISGTASWLIDEDMRHIARMAAGTLRKNDDRMQWLDALLQGRGFDEAAWSAAAGLEKQAGNAGERTKQQIPSAARQEDHAVTVQAIAMQPQAQVDQLHAARRPSKLAVGLGQAASALGGLALVNGLGLAVWSRFGGRPELLSLSVLICVAAVGLLFVSHLLQSNDAPPRKQ